MSGSTEQPLATLPVVATTTGLRILGFDATGKPSAVEPAAFAEAPTGDVGLSDALPLADATPGQAGTATTASRADHRHPLPTAAQVGAAPVAHTHPIADVTGLQAALDGKAVSNHTHSISGVNGLQAALDAKAAVAHQHPMTDVTGLQQALDAKLAATARGAASGVAPLGADGKVPLANLPETATGVSNVGNGTLTGQIPVWDQVAGRYNPVMPSPITADRTPTVERNTATVLSFNEYNRRNIVLTGNAPLTLAASEIGVAPNQGMEFIINNRHTGANTITFGAGIIADPYPLGTGTAGAVKVAPKGLVAVQVYPVGNTLVASVRGQIV